MRWKTSNRPTMCALFALYAFVWAASAEDWPMLDRDASRNAVSPKHCGSEDWDVGRDRGHDPLRKKWENH